ncbi:uncharacterized protein M6B38_102260 [Iris pallida]|uniref:Uncharacterized protein n=1 Tax=Iris pallida TaxID=29817 RepID=A0AAX6INZ5_IRIPA|nr:uncharacterized protein M6B38_102260 [Iris pallida]
MVGIFSRLHGVRSGHRRTQSAVDARLPLPENVEITGTPSVSVAHGIEVAIEFKPVEHPSEPVDYDQPVKCPLPEPSILNDGRIWKERMSSVSSRLKPDLPVVKEGSQLESVSAEAKPPPPPPKRSILPSVSAPEHNLVNLLEDCNVASDQHAG